MASGPLTGIRVLEFTQIIAGPFGCQNLADMGAEVIKVEPPEGEPWRQFSQFIPGESKWFQTLNRGKRSLVLALQEPEAREVVYRLMPHVDVVVINYRPDVAGRLGIDYETLKALRPDLIYVDNTAFGLVVAIPALIAYRIYRSRVDGVLVEMEQQSLRLVDTLDPRRVAGAAPRAAGGSAQPAAAVAAAR